MVEWSITPVLKTGVLKGTGGSNPSLSAKEVNKKQGHPHQWVSFSFYAQTYRVNMILE